MAINLADDAVHALNRAAAAAAREGAEAIAPRHTLAGVISQADPRLLDIFERLDLDPEALPEPMRDLPETYEGHLPFTPAAQEVLGLAVEAASATEDGATTSAHLLLGVARAGGLRSSASLREWGLDPDALAAALIPPSEPVSSGSDDAMPTASGIATALVLAAILACTPDPGADTHPPAQDPFAATPADGPHPGIGPAPDDYRPTAAGAPSTDIWIGRIERAAGGALFIRDLVNATDRDGYDNQPAFDPSGAAVYYTSAIDSTQTETFRYSLDADAPERVTRTPGASEFSPTPIPARDAFSAIREERGRQFLWRYAADGSGLGPDLRHRRAGGLSRLGRTGPSRSCSSSAIRPPSRSATRSPARCASWRKTPAAPSTGSRGRGTSPSCARSPTTSGGSSGWIRRRERRCRLVEHRRTGREDHAWTPEGEILIGDGAVKLLAWSADAGWREVAHPR